MEEGVKSGVFYEHQWKWEWRRDEVVWKMNDEAMVDLSQHFLKNTLPFLLFLQSDLPLVAKLVPIVAFQDNFL